MESPEEGPDVDNKHNPQKKVNISTGKNEKRITFDDVESAFTDLIGKIKNSKISEEEKKEIINKIKQKIIEDLTKYYPNEEIHISDVEHEDILRVVKEKKDDGIDKTKVLLAISAIINAALAYYVYSGKTGGDFINAEPIPEYVPVPNIDIPVYGGDSVMDVSMGGPYVDIYNSSYVYGGAPEYYEVDTDLQKYINYKIVIFVAIIILLIMFLIRTKKPTKKIKVTKYKIIDRLHSLQNHVAGMIGVVTFADSEVLESVDDDLIKVDNLLSVYGDINPELDQEIAKYTDRVASGSEPAKTPGVKSRLLKIKNRVGFLIGGVGKDGENEKYMAACKLLENSLVKLKIPIIDDPDVNSERGRDIPIYLGDAMEMRQQYTDPELGAESAIRNYTETSHSKNSVADLMLLKSTFAPEPIAARILTVKSHNRYQ